jgi:hypothetical protein
LYFTIQKSKNNALPLLRIPANSSLYLIAGKIADHFAWHER